MEDLSMTSSHFHPPVKETLPYLEVLSSIPISAFSHIYYTSSFLRSIPLMPKKEIGQQAFMRFFHAFPSSDSFSLWLDEKPLATDLLYEDFTKYFSLSPGIHTLELRETTTQELLATKKLSLFNQKLYTLLLGAASWKLPVPVCYFLEDIRRPIPDGHLLLRLGHFAPTLHVIEVSLQEEKTLFHHVNYGELTSYTAFPPGEYTLSLRNALTHKVIFEKKHLKLKHYRSYSLYALGNGSPAYPHLTLLPLDGPSYL